MSRIVLALYLASLVLLPWSWFPPFPWLHRHAQWSDALFAVTAVLWCVELWRNKRWPRLGSPHAAMALYLAFAALSLLFASPDQRTGALKLLGMAELCAFAVITSDLAARPGANRAISWAVATTSLITVLAAVAGLVLFYAGVTTRLVGSYGDLIPSTQYARVEAGFYHPNLLASFCIFSAAVVARSDGRLPALLKRVTLVALGLAVVLTLSRGILGFVLAGAIFNANTPRRRRVAAAIGLVSIALIISATLWKPLVDPSHPLEARFEREPSSRWQAASSSLAALVAHPLLGSGLGTSPGTYMGRTFDAHFTPLNIAATLGLPALTVCSALIVLIWRKRRRPTDLAIWGGLAGLALDGLAQDVEDFRHIWVMIGLADASSRCRARQQSAR